MKTYNKVIAGALAVLFSAGATGSIAYANNSGEKKIVETDKEEAGADSEESRKSNGKSAFKDPINSDEAQKDFTIVNSTLKNAGVGNTEFVKK